MSRMKKNSVAFFNSNDIYPVSADSTLPFEQHRDIFYLSGVDQEESVLMLCPNASNPNHREVLFLKETMIILQYGKDQNLTSNRLMKQVGSNQFIGLMKLRK